MKKLLLFILLISACATTGKINRLLKEGKVVQYGKAGDFDSASPETRRVILDHNVTTTGK